MEKQDLSVTYECEDFEKAKKQEATYVFYKRLDFG